MLIKSCSVLSIFGQDPPQFSTEDRETVLTMDERVWSEMGRPQEITVTIEPGNQLDG